MTQAVLTVRTADRTQRFQLVEGELVTIGRGGNCGIRVRENSVSREHCVAVFAAGKVCINDLGSTHGVTHQGQRVDRCELLPGDSCQLGVVRLSFESVGNGAEILTVPQPLPMRRQVPEPLADAPIDRQPVAARSEPAAEAAADRSLDEALEQAIAQVSEPESEDLAEPVVEIAGYRILGRLGAGGFGTVYRAQQVRLDREVALKILTYDAQAADSGERIAAFLREARAAAAINDPRLVQVFDVGEDQGHHFLSMELVTGGSLARRLKRDGPMEWRQVIPLIRDVAHALRAAHQSGLVHRDVKPGNILLTATGQAKLTDLGLAASAEHAGTIAFMAPEQLRRDEVDGRADIYGLGCTAYAALTARAPFVGTRQEIIRAQVKQAPESFQRLGIEMPWHLQQLILESMMAKDPEDRPQDAQALLDRLDRLILPDNEARPQALGAAGRRPAPPQQPRRAEGSRARPKALLARLASEAIIFVMVGSIVVVTLLALKYGWPELDIYRLIGK